MNCIVIFFAKSNKCAYITGFNGSSKNFFLKWCNLVRVGIYFDQMFLKIIPKIVIFI